MRSGTTLNGGSGHKNRQKQKHDIAHNIGARHGRTGEGSSRQTERGAVENGEPTNAIADYDAALHIKKQASSLYGCGLAKKQTGDSTGGESDIVAAKAIDPSIAAEFESSGLR